MSRCKNCERLGDLIKNLKSPERVNKLEIYIDSLNQEMDKLRESYIWVCEQLKKYEKV